MTVLAITVDFELRKCAECDVAFYMPDTLVARRRSDGGDFYCPNGHCLVFRDNDKAKREKAEAELRAARIQLDSERDQRAATERTLANLKKRVKSGVCPCCKRNFCNVQRHMETKHPNFGKQ